jgi:hypothetical protein
MSSDCEQKGGCTCDLHYRRAVAMGEVAGGTLVKLLTMIDTTRHK